MEAHDLSRCVLVSDGCPCATKGQNAKCLFNTVRLVGLNVDVNVTPGPQGQQWPEGTGQSLALRARAADLK